MATWCMPLVNNIALSKLIDFTEMSLREKKNNLCAKMYVFNKILQKKLKNIDI